MFFSKKMFPKIFLIFIDRLQAFSRRSFFAICVPAEMFECDSSPTRHSAIFNFVIKKNFLFHFIDHLF